MPDIACKFGWWLGFSLSYGQLRNGAVSLIRGLWPIIFASVTAGWLALNAAGIRSNFCPVETGLIAVHSSRNISNGSPPTKRSPPHRCWWSWWEPCSRSHRQTNPSRRSSPCKNQSHSSESCWLENGQVSVNDPPCRFGLTLLLDLASSWRNSPMF